MSRIWIAVARRAVVGAVAVFVPPAFAASPSALPDRASPASACAVGPTCPDPKPLLRIETGAHLAMINRVAVDAACKVAVTGSDDKTIRLWRMPAGRLLRTDRPQIDAGDVGQVNAVAVSPDGTRIAAGVQGGGILLFDAESGAIVRRIGTIDDRALDLAISPDGRRLAGALSDDGVRLFDIASGTALATDGEYNDSSYGVAFGPDGAFYATGFDGRLRRYGSDGGRTASVPTPSGHHPYAVAVSPDGQRVAVGYEDAAAVDLFDATTLRHVASGDARGLANARGHDDSYLSYVAWSRDGRLFAGGSYELGEDDRRALRVFDRDGRHMGADVPVVDNTITGIAGCGDNMLVVSAAPSIDLVRPDGTVVALAGNRKVDVRDKLGRGFMISDDAKRVRFGLSDGADDPVLFDLAKGTLTDAPWAPRSGFLEADAASLPVAGWDSEDHPTLAGKPLPLHDDETARSVAIWPDKKGLVLGAGWSVQSFDATGRRLWRVSTPATAWGVNDSRSGALVVVACSDGIIRWLRGRDGQTLLSLFVDAKDRRFVAWTESGYYLASPGAEDLIGWQINRGWTQAATFIPGSRLSARFERPDIVRLVLDTGDEAEAVRRATPR